MTKPSEQANPSAGAPANKNPNPATAAKRKSKGRGKPSKKAAPGIDPAPAQPEANAGIPQSNDGAVVPLLPLLPEPEEKLPKPPVERDDLGRFVPGNNGGPGRPLGSRNKLVEDFIADFREAWRDGGKKALKHMADNEPAAFVRAAVQLMPKDVLVEARGAGLVVVKLTDEDLAL